MRILIIEDNDYKYKGIVEYLNNLGEKDITRKKSVNGGLLELRDNLDNPNAKKYELLFLDMQLPRYEEERGPFLERGGLYVLREIQRKNWPIKVCTCSGEQVDLTGFDDMEQLLGGIWYNCAVYQQPQFERILKKVYDEKTEDTWINIYYSFDANAIKKFISRKQALDYMAEDLADEVRIQTEENGKVEGVDFVVTNEIEDGEYAKISFLNGDVIEWSIPEILP